MVRVPTAVARRAGGDELVVEVSGEVFVVPTR